MSSRISMTREGAGVAGTAMLAVLLFANTLSAQAPASGYVPHRVHDPAAEAFIDFEALAARMAEHDVVLFGELHDDPGTHRLQLALLEGLARRGVDVLLSLEMFERDAQPLLDDYLAGRIEEEEFLEGARPWSNYDEDYRPLVEFARSRGWPVLAANVPRPLAASVAREGLAALDELAEDDRPLVARELDCPRDAYHERFAEAMSVHPMAEDPEEQDAIVWRYYEAQCVKDETMAESIVEALDSMPGRVIVHMTGSFHSDYGLGTTQRVGDRRPEARITTLTGIPVQDLDAPPVAENADRADFLIFTLAPKSEDEEWAEVGSGSVALEVRESTAAASHRGSK